MNATFWVGVFPGLTEAHIDYMIATLSRILRQA
jgi:dTDP-4-amino-4,6-dideoxygalactose transaminase